MDEKKDRYSHVKELPKYRTVITINYDVWAKDEESAKLKAIKQFEEEIGKPFYDVAYSYGSSFRVNTKKIEE